MDIMNRLYYILAFSLSFASFAQAQEMSIFTDQFAFKTAKDMYEVADTLPFDKNAASLIEQIQNNLSKSAIIIENRDIWGKLEKLEPYRKTAQVQALVVECVKKSKTETKRIYNYQFKRAANYYRQNDFKNVVESSLKTLRDEDNVKKSSLPSSELSSTTSFEFALRNNMALALIHLNKDLCAQMELEIIFQQCGIFGTENSINATTHNDEEFIPAAINLTVVYERLGFSEKAKNLSQQLEKYIHKQNYTIPSVDYNAVWFLNNDELFEDNTLIAKALSALKGSNQEKYNNEIQRITLLQESKLQKSTQENYNNENQRETISQSFFNTGIVGEFNLDNTTAIIILIILSLIVWFLYYRILKKYRPPFFPVKVWAILTGIVFLLGLILKVNFSALVGILVALTFVILLYRVIGLFVFSYFLFILIFGTTSIKNDSINYQNEFNTQILFGLYVIVSFCVGIVSAFVYRRKKIK